MKWFIFYPGKMVNFHIGKSSKGQNGKSQKRKFLPWDRLENIVWESPIWSRMENVRLIIVYCCKVIGELRLGNPLGQNGKHN
jgi:hypothetical protein